MKRFLVTQVCYRQMYVTAEDADSAEQQALRCEDYDWHIGDWENTEVLNTFMPNQEEAAE